MVPRHLIKISVLGQIFFLTARHLTSLQNLAVHLKTPHNRMREDHFVHPHPARQPSRDEVNNNQQSWLDIIAEHDHTPSEEEKEEEEEG